MKYDSDQEYIYYPGTNIPKNKLAITVLEELEELEKQLFLRTYENFHIALNEDTVFNQSYLKNLHKFAFVDLYDWAGKYRDKNISKDGSVFCQARFLKTHIDDFFEELKEENYLRNFYEKTPEEFAERIAYFMCELIAIHPFPDLNGRTIRLFFDMIAVYNGYDYISYEGISNRKDNAFIKASISCMGKDCKPMKAIILKGLKKIRK